jgi:serine/threonine protein kinase, bacterial
MPSKFMNRIAFAPAVLAASALCLLAAIPALARASTTAPRTAITTTTIPVGDDPAGIAVDTAAHIVYVANSGSDTVSVISEATDTVTATISVGDYPAGMAVDPNTGTVWVANYDDGTVSVIDEATNTVIDTINVDIDGANDGPNSVVVDAPTDTVYVGQYLGFITAINDQTYAVSQFYSTDSTSHINLGGVDPLTDTLYAGAQDLRAVLEIDTTNGALTGSLGGLGLPTGFPVDDPGTTGYPGYLYVGTFGSNAGVAVYNDINPAITPPLGRIWNFIHTAVNPRDVALDTTSNTLFADMWASDETGKGSVAVISNANAEFPKKTATVTVGKEPLQLAVDPGEGATGTVFVTNSGSNTVTAFAG